MHDTVRRRVILGRMMGRKEGPGARIGRALCLNLCLTLFLTSCGTRTEEGHAAPNPSPALGAVRDASWQESLLSLENSAFLLYSPKPDRLQQLQRQLEYVEKDLGPRLGPSEITQRLEVYDIHDSKVWSELLRHLQVRHEGLALQVENRIYLQPVVNGEGRHLALFHEWVHYAFWSRGWRNLPLWAEEGVAQHYAWNTAQRYARSRHRELTRQHPPLAPDNPFAANWRSLLDIRQYPADEEEARQVYRCSESLVRAILRRLRIDQHAGLWKELSRRPGQLESILNQHFGWTAEDWAAMEADYTGFIQHSLP